MLTALAPTPLPLTRAAWSALRAEVARGSLGASTRPDRDLERRLESIRQVLERAVVVEHDDVAAIGRRVTWRDPDGSTTTMALVIPGDGDPRQGWVSVDAPLGAALVGRRPGERSVVRAPAGDREIRIEAIA